MSRLIYSFQADNFDLNIFMTDYGKGYIKTKRISPDGYIQVKFYINTSGDKNSTRPLVNMSEI